MPTAFERHIRAIGKYDLLTPSRERELSEIINGDFSEVEKEKALDELVGSNTRLVIEIAKKYTNSSYLEEAIADGNLGLVIAAKRFDYRKRKKGLGKFSTFAAYYIRCYIIRGMRQRTKSGIHIPPNIFSIIPSVSKVLEENPELSVETIAKKMKLPVSSIESVKQVLSLSVVEYMATGSDDNACIEPVDTTQASPSYLANVSQLFELVMSVVKDLGYGSDEIALLTSEDSVDSHLVMQLASKRGVTASRIRMLKKEIVWRVRRRLREKMGCKEFEIFFPGFLHPYSWRNNPIPCKKRKKIARAS